MARDADGEFSGGGDPRRGGAAIVVRRREAAVPRAWPSLRADVLAGCGFDVQAPDLFLLTRTGQGRS